jgi:drug/metabolite transporter (DMT)-like permease
MTDQDRNLPLGYALGFLGVVIFGATLPATVIALQDFSPWFITFGRAALATLAAVLCLAAMRRRFPGAMTARLLAAGLLLVYGFPGFMAVAMQSVSASHGGVVLAILPLATAVFAVALTHERPSPAFWVFALAGAALVVWFVLGSSEMHFGAGVFWLTMAGLSASLGYVISARLAAVMPGWEVICWALILTAPISFAGTAWFWEPTYRSADTAPIAAFVYAGLGSMFLGFFAWNAGLAIGGIARVGQIQLLQVFVTVALSAWLLGETITARTILFAGAVALTVWLGRKARVA